MDSPWEGREKFSQEQDLGFQLNCQGPGEPCWEGSIALEGQRRGENTILKLAKRSFCALPSVFFHQ